MKNFGLIAGTQGVWEWVKTETPTRTITPRSVGYTKQLVKGSDGSGNLVVYYRNDTLQRRLYETKKDTNHVFVNLKQNSVLVQYGASGFINYTVDTDQEPFMLTISEVLNPYMPAADTVRSLYQKSSTKRLYPFD